MDSVLALPAYGPTLRAARLALSLTWESFGKGIGYGWRTVAGWERGEHLPKPRAAWAIKTFLNLGSNRCRLTGQVEADLRAWGWVE